MVRPIKEAAWWGWAAMWRVASAMLSQPMSLGRLMELFLRLAITRGEDPVRRREASSA
jgi:hypothetical protein